MKRIILLCCVLSMIAASQVFAAGTWFDDFETYADQAALDAVWSAADAKAKGILETTGPRLKNKSMRNEQYPTETRANRALENQGCLSLWVYDDGEDIKSFDLMVSNTTNYAALGLRDNQVGVATEYTCNKDGTITNTGIVRSKGWHVFQFNTNTVSGTDADSGLPYVTGTEMLIDARRFTGNVLAAMTSVTGFTVYTNFGAATDPNTVWIDTVEWSQIASWGVPRQVRMGDIDEFQPPNGLNDWDVVSGSGTALTNAPDGGEPANLHLDAFDGDGFLKGFYYKGAMTIPRTAYYTFECPYMNGPSWAVHNPWPELTFHVCGTEFNEGSSSTGIDWAYVGAPGGLNWYFRQRVPAIVDDPISIDVTGDPNSGTLNCFVRLYRCELNYVCDYTPPPPPTRAGNLWNLYE